MEKKYEPYSLDRKRAAVEVYRETKRLCKEEGVGALTPISLAQAASGGAAPSQIFRWLKQDLSDEANQDRIRRGRPPRALSDDQEALLVGFAVSRRSSLETVSLECLEHFCDNYLNVKPALSTISEIMAKHGLSSQRALKRSSRMTSEEVVDDALDAVEEIRNYNYPPHRILSMDETGLWSNVTAPKTYHFRNWFVFFLFLSVAQFRIRSSFGILK
jgi:hypothetical protein